ncbi:hypothetical protein Pcinc_005804 [Petrolisthes cinctipes]|uniref:Uncharacterized protein n=1 Tax=Petrolisthes cinctipes TaxID=88211 RepID=A0AAE1KYY7_PETCI|nr:hypothetical protein Pcinc_005804 [Petrolisthes cinctipes]
MSALRRVQPAPFQPLPIVTEPFLRVVIDLTQVGGWQQPSMRKFRLTVVTQLLQKFGSDLHPDRLEE